MLHPEPAQQFDAPWRCHPTLAGHRAKCGRASGSQATSEGSSPSGADPPNVRPHRSSVRHTSGLDLPRHGSPGGRVPSSSDRWRRRRRRTSTRQDRGESGRGALPRRTRRARSLCFLQGERLFSRFHERLQRRFLPARHPREIDVEQLPVRPVVVAIAAAVRAIDRVNGRRHLGDVGGGGGVASLTTGRKRAHDA
jgi:hypothetical protein